MRSTQSMWHVHVSVCVSVCDVSLKRAHFSRSIQNSKWILDGHCRVKFNHNNNIMKRTNNFDDIWKCQLQQITNLICLLVSCYSSVLRACVCECASVWAHNNLFLSHEHWLVILNWLNYSVYFVKRVHWEWRKQAIGRVRHWWSEKSWWYYCI